MKRISFFLWLLMAVLASSGCAPRWKPVNRFTDEPREIPLKQAYVFQATPLDRTLKAMLARWAADTGMALAYRHPSDFTLHKRAAQIRATRLVDALLELEAAYGQRLALAVDGNAISVGDASTMDHAVIPAPPTGQ